jgi:hypothetical protein
MRKALMWIVFLWWLGAAVKCARSETEQAETRKAGLWEVNAVTRIQKPGNSVGPTQLQWAGPKKQPRSSRVRTAAV